jgi:hypothetical protein
VSQITVRGSTGAREDRSAEGAYVARGIYTAHSEVVGRVPFQGTDCEGRACRCTQTEEAAMAAAGQGVSRGYVPSNALVGGMARQ